MWDPCSLKPLTIVTGHYGTGKTNLSINLAFDLVSCGSAEAVTLVDLDIVNPYFRSSDYSEELESRDVRVVGPTFARTTLDTPSLSGAVDSVFLSDGAVTGRVLFDVGGDDAGATTLGRYAEKIRQVDHDLLYVINKHRNLTQTSAEAADLLREIEAASGLRATGIIDNSHLQAETTASHVLDSIDFAHEVCALLDLPLICVTVPHNLLDEVEAALSSVNRAVSLYPVNRYVHAPWEADSRGLATDPQT